MDALKPVIVGVDRTAASARAAAAGWRIAEAGGRACRLVHVVDDLIGGLAIPGTPSSLPGFIVGNARAQVEHVLEGAVPEDQLANLEVHLGKPAIVLNRLAADAELLVVGGKHHTALGRWIMGSTAHQLVPLGSGPVLVAGPSGDTPYRILVAVDLYTPVHRVLAVAERLARLFRSDLAVLHVIEPVLFSYATDPFGVTVGNVVDDGDWARASEEDFDQNVWPRVNYGMAEKIIRRGPIVETIRHEVERWRADLLVLGSHGKGWRDRLLLGSTTYKLLNDLLTSTLVVPVGEAEAPASPVATAATAGTGATP